MIAEDRSTALLYRIACAIVLLLAIRGTPGIYTFVRWALFILFPLLAFFAWANTVSPGHFKPAWTAAWISFAVGAVLFNPVATLHLGRSGWLIVDWFFLALIVGSEALERMTAARGQ